MVCPIAYDITRLASRVFNRTPNGIDRVDFAFARHFVGADRGACNGVLLTVLGPRSVSGESARGIVDMIADHWGETASSEGDRSYRRIVAWLGGGLSADAAAERIVQGRSGRAGAVARWIARHGVPLGRSPSAALPRGSV
ncbi:MAG TPA: glycosyltransferase family 1 protein, partial [Beijerinckiaceae bacterium]|nr:glycosyltransferase family 1 protein [Beijerinckiaceae bacterium]